ncbi:TetR/AcrR family transcriptional regulator [Schleiferilactobacillus perolens]|jgi:AcrR family transcriptional regulator|uniref:TetR/AcrR family transcriptional regulator n=1 Tax=Schleiferilactobacillus perolens TaxID=100468 RepID=UPI0023551142|nr:TetR/AcrR family transcriptional regulator [Schleiferilactobacillus perolens]MCI2170917.1 TetR/AcrR family transcriptional regulator [Schleiferilactobacillus perolens]
MPETSRDIQKQKTKQRIYETALQLFKENGYADTSIRQITKAAHVSLGTFYVHYTSKQDIIRDNYYEALAQYVKQHYAQYLADYPTASLRDKILNFSLLQLQLSAEQGWQFVTIVFTAFFEEALDESVEPRDWEMLDTLRKLLVQANTEGQLVSKDPQTAFQQLYTSVRGMMATWAYRRGQFDLVQTGRDYLEVVLDALLNR